MLVGCVLSPIDSEVIYRRHPHLLSLADVMKLGKYTVPMGNRTPGHNVTAQYTTAVPRKLLFILVILCWPSWIAKGQNMIVCICLKISIYICTNLNILPFI